MEEKKNSGMTAKSRPNRVCSFETEKKRLIGIYRADELAHKNPRLLLEEKLSPKVTDVV